MLGVDQAYIEDLDRSICATEADCASLAQLVRSLGTHPQILEIGSWIGRSAIAMADAGARVICVDTWKGSEGDTTKRVVDEIGGRAVYEKFLANIGDRDISPYPATSEHAARAIRGKFDMVFIDAAHDYESVKADIEAWWPRVRKGGILCGHDMHPAMEGVWKAVEDSGPYETMPDSIWLRRK